jgi:hypothetical protein
MNYQRIKQMLIRKKKSWLRMKLKLHNKNLKQRL